MGLVDPDRQREAARKVQLSLAATRGYNLIDRLRAWYGGPWETCIPEDLIARALADLRSAGFDVATAADSDEVREASYDVPVRRARETYTDADGRLWHLRHDPPPIPWRGADWQAVSDDYEPGHPIAEGPTREACIADIERIVAGGYVCWDGEPDMGAVSSREAARHAGEQR